MSRVNWPDVLSHAADIVRSYDTLVTLRQLFYRLVSDETLPNVQSYYRRLSARTAEARRTGSFPDLLDRTSRIERAESFDGVADVMDYVVRYLFRRDRTEGQPWSIYLGVEKAGLSQQLNAWFGDELGVPILALGGYGSQTFVDEVRRDIEDFARPAVLIYAGDLDPTGEDIDRDFEHRVAIFDKVIRVALMPEQVTAFSLPFNPDAAVIKKLGDDPRAARFLERHGALVQYEVDALPPDTLRNLYQTALEPFWDSEAHQASLAREDGDLTELHELAGAAG